AAAALTANVLPAQSQIDGKLKQIMNDRLAAAGGQTAQIISNSQWSIRSNLSLSIIVMLATGIFGFYVTRLRISKPILKAAAAMEEVSRSVSNAAGHLAAS